MSLISKLRARQPQTAGQGTGSTVNPDMPVIVCAGQLRLYFSRSKNQPFLAGFYGQGRISLHPNPRFQPRP